MEGIISPSNHFYKEASKGRRLASKGNVSFTYDAEGHRLTKTAGGVEHKYLWQGDRLISEQYGSNTLEHIARELKVEKTGNVLRAEDFENNCVFIDVGQG